MKKVHIALLLIAVLFGKEMSAQSLPATLLWKISGNGLPKPSYLYGTMHLTDERVFNIGDSMYKAMENSEGFAIEINPDDFTPFLIDETKRNLASRQRLKDMMSDKDFKKYGKALAKKLNKNENDITTADVLKEKNKWMEDSYKTGKMQTFLDAYLFDIARRQGKWTGGVEDMQDQENLVNYLVDESDIEELATDDDNKIKSEANSEGNEMINIYLKSDLNGIERLSGLGDSVFHDKMLTRRNRKMAMRMDSLSHVRSMVFAVGAAHLPGSDGLIALLKEKGFTVTPVFSSKKIAPVNYKVANVALPWYDVQDESDFYSASMPGKPGDMTVYGILNMKMYFDVFNSTVYMTSALNTPYSETMADSVLGVVAASYFNTNDYKKGKPVTINNVPGREFLLDGDRYSHGYLLYKDGMIYMAVAMKMRKKDTTAENAIDRFLHSYVIHEPKADNTKYITYTNAAKAYSVDLPAQPKPAGDLTAKGDDQSIARDLQIVIDPKSGDYLFLGANEAAPGYFIPNDSTMLAQIKEAQKTKFTSYTIDTMYLKNGQRMMELGGMMAQAPLMMKAHYEFRGNRWYALVALYNPKKESTVVDHFFSSFKMLDYAPLAWNNNTTNDALFSTWAPGGFTTTNITDSTDLNTTYKYECFDSTRANNYSITAETFSKYYWRKNDSVMLENLAHNNIAYTDTILSQKWITNGGVRGIELAVQGEGSGNIKRKRVLLNDNKVYVLITSQPVAEVYNSNNDRFFDDFRFAKEASNSRLFQSKASVLLTDLLSPDSSIHAKAKNYLQNAAFSPDDLPLLHEAFLKKYDDEADYSTTKDALQKVITKLADSSSYRFAKEHYAAAGDTDKNLLLGIMLSFPTTEHFTYIQNLLQQQPPALNPGYSFVNLFTDSLSLAAAAFPGLLPLLSDTAMAPPLIRIASILLDSGYLTTDVLQPYQLAIIQFSQLDLRKIKSNADDYDYASYAVLHVLAAMNNAAANTALQSWTALKKNPYLVMTAASHLLRNKQTLASLTWQNLAAENATRTELYDTLLAYKKAAFFPKEYLTQKYFAESYIYTEASDDDEPSGLIYLTQKVVSFKGRQARFYFYKVSYGEGEDATHSLACAGPFAVSITDVSSKQATGSLYYKENFDPDNLPAQMDALLKQTENGLAWNKSGDK